MGANRNRPAGGYGIIGPAILIFLAVLLAGAGFAATLAWLGSRKRSQS